MSASHGAPKLRGVLHHWAALVALGAGIMLWASAPTALAAWAAAIYVSSVLLLFSMSAAYHRITWSLTARARMRRVDHACIFILIAGSYTPICLLALPEAEGGQFLWLVWLGATLGLLRVFLWARAPRLIIAAPYLLLGWLAILYLPALRQGMTSIQFGLLLSAGLIYSIGALAYVLKRPEPIPGVFGHHEVFHLFTIIAAGVHFACVASLVRNAAEAVS
jgi:hemolysin III